MRTATSPWRSTALRRRGASSRTGPVRSGKPGTVGVDDGGELAQLLADPGRGGASASDARGDGALHREDPAHGRRQCRRDLGELLVGELVQLDAELLAATYARAGHLVGDPERHPLAHQPLGDVGREREALGASSVSRAVLKLSVAT